MSKYRVVGYPTFLTQCNVYQLQINKFLHWKTIADFRSLDAALEIKRKFEDV